ncbi:MULTISPECIES: ArnT family glycosyltransferase [Pirellulaceae]|uniref:ArnT family glycosyltransferase n=1 Tax=Pirellulaceae TaxID=2691357 RepID=UPI001304EBEC|nr:MULTISPECIES: glycosyltransferase family 39 protein [Pirellulaceae]
MGAVVYALWYFSVPMPWPAPPPGETPFLPTRGTLVQTGLLLLPETISFWFGGGDMPLGLLDRLGVTLIAGVMLLFSYALGEFLLARLKLLDFFGRVDGIVLRLAIGLTVLSWSTAVLGMCGLLHRPLSIVLSLAILFVTLGSAWKKQLFAPRESEADAEEAETKQPEGESWWWLLAAAPLCLFIVGVSILPPYEYDVLEYHLLVPKEWHIIGQIRMLPNNVYSGMPMGAEMWALLPMIFLTGPQGWLTGALVGKLIIGLFTLLTAGLLYGAGKRLIGVWGGRAAALAAIAVPWLTYQSGTGLVDGVWAFFTLAATYPVLIVLNDPSKEEHRDGLAILSGLMAGMAFSVKYPALLVVVLPVFGLWIFAVRTDWRLLVMHVVAVTVAISPWLMRNAIDTGNPVFPLAGNVFPTDVRSEDQIQQWNRAHQVPKNADGNRYSINQLFSGIMTPFGRSPWAGMIIVPLAICGLFYHDRKLVIPLVVLLAVCWIVWWGLSHRLERFLIPAIPLGCLLAGIGAQKLAPFVAGRVALRIWLGLGLLVGFMLVNQTQSIKLDPRVFVSLDALAKSHTSEAVAFLNENVPPGDAVLATGDAALFYLQPPVFYHTCFNDSTMQQLVDMTKQQRQAHLAEANIAWIYVHWGEIERFRSPGNYGFPSDVTRELFAQMESQGILEPAEYQLGNPENPTVVIYRVLPASGP